MSACVCVLPGLNAGGGNGPQRAVCMSPAPRPQQAHVAVGSLLPFRLLSRRYRRAVASARLCGVDVVSC